MSTDNVQSNASKNFMKMLLKMCLVFLNSYCSAPLYYRYLNWPKSCKMDFTGWNGGLYLMLVVDIIVKTDLNDFEVG